MLSYGQQIPVKTRAEVDKMRQRTRTVWDAAANKYFPRRMLDQVIAHLADYRGKVAGAQQ